MIIGTHRRPRETARLVGGRRPEAPREAERWSCNAAPLQADVEAPAPLVRISALSASFGAVRPLSDVDVRIDEGEIVALAGEPGAGKTSLVRCIAGDIAPTGGRILMAGRALPADPGTARRRGIGVVWQDLALCDNLDVAGNLLLGQEDAAAAVFGFSLSRRRRIAA